MTPQRTKRFVPHLIGLAAILLFGFSPFIPVVTASLVAGLNGCRLDEGSRHACVIVGQDFGGILYSMGVMGWIGLVTIPAAACLLVAWAVWVAISLLSMLRPVRR